MLTRVLLWGLILVRPIGAQVPPRQPIPTQPVSTPAAEISPASTPAPRGLRDRAELEGFMDGVMAAQLREHHIAGATVAVVKGGGVFFAKGYGSANVRQQRSVAADSTMFRIGSVSKLFTWTAVMQLVEQGKLDLNADINTYLDFKIPATFPEPITLTHVMTHTPGLEEDPRDLFTEDSSHITAMGKWLPAHMPTRVRPPGTYAAYSNWATARRGLHRRARERHAVRRIRGQAHPRAVRHDADDVASAAAGAVFRRTCPKATSGRAATTSLTSGR